MSKDKPLIGISTSAGPYDSGPLKGVTRQWVSCQYAESVAMAGGVPLLLPMLADAKHCAETTRALVELVDGIIITGGGEIRRGLIWGQGGEGHEGPRGRASDLPATPELRTLADEALINAALDAGKPLLGICYGMQLINATMGGKITADFHAWLGLAHADQASIKHTPTRGGAPCGEVSHSVWIQPGTELHRILIGTGGGDENDPSAALARGVTSLHVQGIAVEHVAPGLVVSALSADGCVEALESLATATTATATTATTATTAGGSGPWVLGLQWHPEQMPDQDMGPVFTRLCDRALAHREDRQRRERREHEHQRGRCLAAVSVALAAAVLLLFAKRR